MSFFCRMSIMLVHTPLRKSWLCDTSTRVLSPFFRYSSSHTHASRSRWAVGSSRSSSIGLTKSAFASATLIRHPPDMSFVFFMMVFLLKPRPVKISDARVWNVDGSIFSMRCDMLGQAKNKVWANLIELLEDGVLRPVELTNVLGALFQPSHLVLG